MRVEVGARVHARTALDDRDLHAAAGEVRGERASGGAGADDDDVEDVGLHARCTIVRSAGERRQPSGARGIVFSLSRKPTVRVKG